MTASVLTLSILKLCNKRAPSYLLYYFYGPLFWSSIQWHFNKEVWFAAFSILIMTAGHLFSGEFLEAGIENCLSSPVLGIFNLFPLFNSSVTLVLCTHLYFASIFCCSLIPSHHELFWIPWSWNWNPIDFFRI